MLIWVYAIVIAIANRFRGGGVFVLAGEKTFERDGKDKKHTQIRRLTYAGIVGLLALNPYVGAAAFLATLTGWGFPISAAIGKRAKTDWEEEFLPFDKASKWIVEKIYGEYCAQPYGVVWLTFHGLMTGILFAIALMIPVAINQGIFESIAFFNPLFLGMGFMGFCYAVTSDWERGEILDGFLKGSIIGATVAIQIANLF